MAKRTQARQHNERLHRAVLWSFDLLVRAWPAASREWALAMRAELTEIDNSYESLHWLAGGMMSLIKAWWNRALYRDASRKPAAPVKAPGLLAALTLLAAVALLLIPSANQGLRAVLNSWQSRDLHGQHDHDQLMKLAQDAETRGDAKTIAFVAMRLWPPSDSVPLANKAVAIDPSLTWIFSQGYYVTYMNPGTRDWPAKLQAWDPGNAAGYLLEAEVRQGVLNPDFRAPWDIARHDSQWIDAGRKAVEAPRYDSYYDRRLKFDREIILALGIANHPDWIAGSSSRMGHPNSSSAMFYSKKLLAEAKLAFDRGDTQTAKRNAWAVVDFGELLKTHGGTRSERFWSFEFTDPAYKVLQPILAAEGRHDEAAMLGKEIESMELRYDPDSVELFELPSSTQAWLYSSSYGMNLGTAFTVFFSVALLFAGFWLVASRYAPDLRSGAIFRNASLTARYAPAGLLASIGMLAVSYWPISEAMRTYLEKPLTDSTLRNLWVNYYSVYLATNFFRSPATGAATHSLFWLLVIVAGLFTVSMIIGRAMINRAPRAKAAA